MLPALVERSNVQQANALVAATTQALSVGGWALAAGLVTVLPISTFFALNAASFLVSAAFIARVRVPHPRAGHVAPSHVRERSPRWRRAGADDGHRRARGRRDAFGRHMELAAYRRSRAMPSATAPAVSRS
jgi:hypothetical protein